MSLHVIIFVYLIIVPLALSVYLLLPGNHFDRVLSSRFFISNEHFPSSSSSEKNEAGQKSEIKKCMCDISEQLKHTAQLQRKQHRSKNIKAPVKFSLALAVALTHRRNNKKTTMNNKNHKIFLTLMNVKKSYIVVVVVVVVVCASRAVGFAVKNKTAFTHFVIYLL